MNNKSNRKQLAREARSIVALAFRNGPIEELHAGRPCTACEGQAGYSRISDAEMKRIMTNAVDSLFTLLCLKDENPSEYESRIAFGEKYTVHWHEPNTVERRKPNTD